MNGIETAEESEKALKLHQRELLEVAFQLPLAGPELFIGGRTAPEGVDPELIRQIMDTQLRSKLIRARLAQGLQSPKGPQRIASIIRLFPDADAPEEARPSRTSRVTSVRTSGSASVRRSKGIGNLPTVVEMKTLLMRLEAMAGHVARETSIELDQKIAEIQANIALATGDQLQAMATALTDALRLRSDNTTHVFREAARRVESDTSFPERAYLRLLAV